MAKPYGRLYNNGINVSLTPIDIYNIYPIGSIYISVNSTNPSTYFGGTWELFNPGRTLVCVNTSDTALNTAKKTGGSTNPLTLHNHSASSSNAGNHNHNMRWDGGFTTITGSLIYWGGSRPAGQYVGTEYAGDHSHPISVNNNGDNTNHNNWQPFTTCYIWLRTA